jgi:hypothetical protein
MHARYSYIAWLLAELSSILNISLPSTTSSILKLQAVNYRFSLPTVFHCKNSQVALEDICDICTQQILPPSPHSFDERPYQAKVATLAHTFERRPVYGRLSRAEMGYRELIHITHDLPKSKMQACLSLAYQGRVCDHREGGSCP